ncbi:transporter substrate-binding domain-containing protein [Alteromonadaceae bacterium BrNp21-10]|nr:transporter substrate-binding domain-containing protein [Alteromonadaceae bacterium BrNp21-10]
MQRLLIRYCLLIVYCCSQPIVAQDILYSSVSPEFPDGLHAKYLRYIAEKMDMQLDLFPMPFARRVLALQNGKIDIMVGMQRENSSNDDIIYIFPSYEKLRHTLFVLKSNNTRLTNFEDLTKLKIGVTIHAKYYRYFQERGDLSFIAVSSLRQKIELLLKGRTDTFIHYQESTLPLLRELKLLDKVVPASFQPTESKDYYVTISEKSRLQPYKIRLQKVIENGVLNNDFGKIRQAHYQKNN